MSIWDDLKQDLTLAEGRVERVYRDTEGNLTAGIGHLLTRADWKQYELHDKVSDEQINIWYLEDEKFVRDSIAKHFHNWGLYPHIVKLAIGNWIFQLGPNAPLRWHRATAAIVAMDWETAADEFEYADPRVHRLSKWYLETPARCMQEVKRLRHAAALEKSKEEE